MLERHATAAALIMLAIAEAAVAQSPSSAKPSQKNPSATVRSSENHPTAADPLDPMFDLSHRWDDLSAYPGPRLTTPGPAIPHGPAPTDRVEEGIKRVRDKGSNEILDKVVPGTKAARDMYGWAGTLTDPTAGDVVCAPALATSAAPYYEDCAAVVDAAWPENTSTRADIEREDTERNRKQLASAERWLDSSYYQDDDPPYSVSPIEPPASLRVVGRRSHASLEGRRDELAQQLQGKIGRDRDTAAEYRDGARRTDDFLADLNRRLSDPALDPAQRRTLSEGAEHLKLSQQIYKDEGVVPSPARDGYVAPPSLPVYQPRQPTVVLPPSDAPRGGGKVCRAATCRAD